MEELSTIEIMDEPSHSKRLMELELPESERAKPGQSTSTTILSQKDNVLSEVARQIIIIHTLRT